MLMDGTLRCTHDDRWTLDILRSSSLNLSYLLILLIITLPHPHQHDQVLDPFERLVTLDNPVHSSLRHEKINAVPSSSARWRQYYE